MLDMIRKLFLLLNARERQRFYAVMMLALVSGMLEMVSVAAILPFLAVLSDPTRVETHALLHRIYDGLGFTTTIEFLVFLSLCVLGLVILSLCVRLVTIYAIARFANMRAYSLSGRLMENYLRQPYPWFLGRNGAHLSKVILVEVQRVVNEAIMPVMLTLSQFALVLSLFGLLLVVEPTIALFAVVLFGGSYVLVFILARRALAQIGSVILASNGERFKAVHEAMSSIKDVKILGVERTFLERFRKPTGEMAIVSSRAAVIGEAPRSILQALALAGMLVLILHLLVNRSGSLNDIVPTMGIFAFAGLRLFPALQMIYRQIGTLKVTQPAVDELFADMMETEAQAMTWPKDRAPSPSTTSSSSTASATPIQRPAVPHSTASTSPSPPAAPSASSAAPGPARPRSSTSCSACSGPTRARSGSTGCRSPGRISGPGRRTSATCRSRSRSSTTRSPPTLPSASPPSGSTWPPWNAPRALPSCTTSS